jgi:hypothetical protein
MSSRLARALTTQWYELATQPFGRRRRGVQQWQSGTRLHTPPMLAGQTLAEPNSCGLEPNASWSDCEPTASLVRPSARNAAARHAKPLDMLGWQHHVRQRQRAQTCR